MYLGGRERKYDLEKEKLKDLWVLHLAVLTGVVQICSQCDTLAKSGQQEDAGGSEKSWGKQNRGIAGFWPGLLGFLQCVFRCSRDIIEPWRTMEATVIGWLRHGWPGRTDWESDFSGHRRDFRDNRAENVSVGGAESEINFWFRERPSLAVSGPSGRSFWWY